ncbi:MAG: GTPase HflX [Bacteroidia bacterium]|nr:GTPase HflX [Bacteroidia bacterium]
MKQPYFYTEKKKERAVLVGVHEKSVKIDRTKEYLDELEALTTSAGAETVGRLTQNLDYPNPRTFIGEGKLQELVEMVNAYNADLIIFDDELSPSQIRNIEKEFKEIKIIDRSMLILDIFSKNAKTAQARTQVELAQNQYLLPRLTKMWTHLSKQKGGIGMKGPGETEIETDRRVIRENITKLKYRLEEIEKQNKVQRQNRNDKARVALVGYTNVGKSTIMNLLSKSDVLAENKLFATLDSTVRKVVFEDPDIEGAHVPVLLSDTVGFIRKLPTLLIESFKSTLAEVVEADVLLHVVDVSNPEFENQMELVKQTLYDIGAKDKPMLLVFNKIDTYIENNPDTLLTEFENSWLSKEHNPVVFISAVKKSNIDQLKSSIARMVKKSFN